MTTPVRILPDHTEVTLPSGRVLMGYPQGNEEQSATALRLGYGHDVLAMVLDHDPLHARLCDWLGLPASYSLRLAAGELPKREAYLADIEEEAVIAVQRFMQMSRNHASQDAEAARADAGHGHCQSAGEGR